MKNRKAKESLDDILNKLIQYTSTHFTSEENLFSRYSYPNTEMHIADHKKFVEEVLSFKEDYDRGRIIVTFEVMDFLISW